MKNYILLSLFLFLAACADSSRSLSLSDAGDMDESGIVGAERINRADSGFKAAVSIELHGRAFCTGTLVDGEYVVTAGHCVSGQSADNLEVKFFNQSISAVKGFVLHPKYREAQMSVKNNVIYASDKDDEDIAVIRLEKRAPPGAISAKLPVGSLKVGQYSLRAYGAGRSGFDINDQGTMRVVNLRGVVRKGKENKIFYSQKTGKGVCSGDSGGPNFIYKNNEPILAAVTMELDEIPLRNGIPDDACRASGVVLQVGPYVKWIEQAKKSLR